MSKRAAFDTEPDFSEKKQKKSRKKRTSAPTARQKLVKELKARKKVIKKELRGIERDLTSLGAKKRKSSSSASGSLFSRIRTS